MYELTAPAPSAGPVVLADWLELRALLVQDRNSSVQDLVRSIRAASKGDEGGEIDRRGRRRDITGEQAQQAASDAFLEIEERVESCGDAGNYPFKLLSGSSIQLKGNSESSIYLFLLLVSYFARDDKESLDLFEDLSAEVAAEYFGGRDNGAYALAFGFPRRYLPAGFAAALDEMCKQLGEGEGHRPHPLIGQQKDAKLDVVAWRAFSDGRVGKLIGFGQCATGQTDWSAKLPELQPSAFNKSWLRGPIAVDPVRLFFVPFRIDTLRFDLDSNVAGIIFDRCRMSDYGEPAPASLRRRMRIWTRATLARLRQ